MVAVSLLAAVFSHLFVNAISLDGAWEMAYSPYEYSRDIHRLPEFKGKVIENAIPGYWEDLFDSEQYRIHPLYHQQTFPISGTAEDMTLPNIYGTFFYRRTINLDRTGEAFLRFEGVRNQVHIWVNGKFVSFRQGFSTPFEIKIPGGYLKKGENNIVLAVSNCPNLGWCDYVTGLTTRSIFGGTGGVNGHLELSFPENGIGDVYVTTSEDLKSFTVHVGGSTEYQWEIAGLGKGTVKGDLTLPTGELQFWSPEHPKLYEMTLTAGGKSVVVPFGLRRLVPDGERLLLNGKAVYLRGVTEHCYFPLTVHVPRDLEYYRMITAKRKELGFNFVRFHTFVPPVEYLTACDESGMLVHIESPNFVDIPEYEAIIAFARSHPSVVIYSTGNETRIDNVTEAYLKEISDRVHTMSDGLFSPMSALRGLEYALFPGHDTIRKTPWPHNPERFDRVGKYADLYTTYQNSATSYDAINSPYSAEFVDSWGEVYRKPRLAHEICIDGTYVDFATEKKYPQDSPILKSGLFSGLRKMLSEKGLLERADLYYRNSCEWQRRCRKFCFEKIRAMKRTMGYDFLGDINTHWHTYGYSVGMMDEFYNLKYSETKENVLRYNSAAVLLCDLGSDFNFRSGDKLDVGFSISNFDEDLIKSGGTLCVSVVNEKGRKLTAGTITGLAAPMGEVTYLGRMKLQLPEIKSPQKYSLRAEYVSNGRRVSNEWEIYSFSAGQHSANMGGAGLKVVTDISRDELLKAMEEGESVLLFGAGPFNSLPATFQCGLPGRCGGNIATVIKNGHPALGKFPHEGFCGWQFRRLMEGAPAIQLEAGVPFDPVIDLASSVKFPIRQSFLFEYRVGKGKLLVCSLKFNPDDPAATYLRSQLLSYACSKNFSPKEQITIAQLAAVIDAPLLDGGKNTNNAGNANDPSSAVRVPKR